MLGDTGILLRFTVCIFRTLTLSWQRMQFISFKEGECNVMWWLPISFSLYIYSVPYSLSFFLFFLKLCTSFTFSFLITSHRFVFSPPHTSTITNADLPISALVFHTVLFLLHIVFGITLVNCTMLIQCPSSISLTLSSEILFCFECLFPRKILLDCDFFLVFL